LIRCPDMAYWSLKGITTTSIHFCTDTWWNF
jgi:hypothetical protein